VFDPRPQRPWARALATNKTKFKTVDVFRIQLSHSSTTVGGQLRSWNATIRRRMHPSARRRWDNGRLLRKFYFNLFYAETSQLDERTSGWSKLCFELLSGGEHTCAGVLKLNGGVGGSCRAKPSHETFKSWSLLMLFSTYFASQHIFGQNSSNKQFYYKIFSLPETASTSLLNCALFFFHWHISVICLKTHLNSVHQPIFSHILTEMT